MKHSILGSVLFVVCTFGFYEAQAQVNGLYCYKCNSNENDLCLDEPHELPSSSQARCDGYCTILRTEHTDIPGVVVTLVRDCEEKPLVQNEVRTDKHYTKMYTTCETTRCNTGDGKREPNENDGGLLRPKNTIIVQESASSWMFKPSLVFTIGAIIITFLH